MRKNLFIAVGGRSGSGKTTLINSLIKCFPSLYKRPISYTTRVKRTDESDEEYRFISHSEFVRLNQNGEFFNVDCIYGNSYAIKYQSIIDILFDEKIPIKEIHPQNHFKIQAAFEGIVLSVLVKSDCTSAESLERTQQDNLYYDNIDEDAFDIVFFYDINLTPEKNAYYFNERINAIVEFMSIYPPSGQIDKLNRCGYEKAAIDFTEEKRITTRNFHELSLAFFRKAFEMYVTKDTVVAEIGPGRGWLYGIAAPKCQSYVGFDISSSMLNANSLVNKIVSSIRCTNSEAEIYDVVVASLADPYLYPEAICEIGRILKEQGYFVFSIPANEWATGLRKEKKSWNKTSFVLDSGETVQVFSFIPSDAELDILLRSCGFEKVFLKQEAGDSLNGGEVSPAISSAADYLNKSISDLNIVTTAIYRKRCIYTNE